MLRHFNIGLALLLFAAPQLAFAKPIIADLSQYHIAIDARFSGTTLLMFGARNDVGDVITAIRGPERDFTIMKKERVSGIWANTDLASFEALPDYLDIASSRPLDKLPSSSYFDLLELGPSHLAYRSPKPLHPVNRELFVEALLAHLNEEQLYSTASDSLQFMGETLFKHIAYFPDHISRGTYTAEAYLFENGELRGMQSIPVTVEKIGFDAFVSEFAHRLPMLYGLLAVAFALGIGWVSNRIFSRL